MYLDWTTLATINEFDEVCCPNCGSWAAIEDLKTEADGNITCTLCRY